MRVVGGVIRGYEETIMEIFISHWDNLGFSSEYSGDPLVSLSFKKPTYDLTTIIETCRE